MSRQCIEVYEPISRQRCPGKRLLILDGYESHIIHAYLLSWCGARDIIVFRPPPHSIHHAYFNHSMLVSSVLYNNTIASCRGLFLITSHSTNRGIFFPIYKEALEKEYSIDIKAAFKATGTVSLNPRVVLCCFQNLLPKAAAANPIQVLPAYLRRPFTTNSIRSQVHYCSFRGGNV